MVNNMKKNLLKKLVAMMVVATILTGCGVSGSSEPATSITEEIVVESTTEFVEDEVIEDVTQETEEVIELNETEEISGVQSFSKEFTTETYGYALDTNDVDRMDNVTKYSFEKEVDYRYFVGRKDSTATNFSQHNSHDKVLYLGKSMFLPASMNENIYYVSVSDETVAKVKEDELVPLKQGCFVLTTYDKDGNKIEDINYIVTTYNDSKTPEQIMSDLTFDPILTKSSIYKANPIKELEYWKIQCSTLMDVVYYFQARRFYYSGEGEPQGNSLGGEVVYDWMWNNGIETVFEASKGVCLQAAQMAVHLLANDFEDWGVFCIDGNQGHIFNWFYEDGNYYVIDYTEVISDNADFYHDRYKDYSHAVYHFTSYEDMTSWVKNSGKVDLNENYIIYEYSLNGYDDLPATTNSAKSDTSAVVYGSEKEVTYCMQDIIVNSIGIIYIKEDIGLNINFEPVSEEEMSSRLPHGVIDRDEEYRFYYNY